MCFRCIKSCSKKVGGWRSAAIKLKLRFPGKELLNINNSQPMFWETMFLFGAIGLFLGVWYFDMSPLYPYFEEILTELLETIGFDSFIDKSAPWWVMINSPGHGEVMTWGNVISLSTFMLASMCLILGFLYLLTAISADYLLLRMKEAIPLGEVITRLGYIYTPLCFFSAFLGLSRPSFEYLYGIGVGIPIIDVIRASLFGIGIIWSYYLAFKIVKLQEAKGGILEGVIPHIFGISFVAFIWYPVLFEWWTPTG
jgi:hypothetical protein